MKYAPTVVADADFLKWTHDYILKIEKTKI